MRLRSIEDVAKEWALGTAWQVCIGQEERFDCSNCDAEFGEEESGLSFPDVEIVEES